MPVSTSPSVSLSGWIDTPLINIAAQDREAHVRYCSYFADNVLDRFPEWAKGLDQHQPPAAKRLEAIISEAGLDAGLRRFRNHQMKNRPGFLNTSSEPAGFNNPGAVEYPHEAFQITTF